MDFAVRISDDSYEYAVKAVLKSKIGDFSEISLVLKCSVFNFLKIWT